MAKHGIGSFLPFLAPLALAAPFIAPELGAAIGIGAGAEGAAGAGALADIGAAAAPEAITAGAAPLAAETAGITLPEVSVTAPAIGGLDAGTAAALSPGLLAPAIDSGSQALPSASSAVGDVLPGTVGSMPGPAAGQEVTTLTNALQPTGPGVALDPPGFGAPASDIPGALQGADPLAAGTGGADFSGGETPGFLSGVSDWFKQNEGLLKGVGAATSLGTLGYQMLNAPKYPTGPTTAQIPGGTPLSAAAGTAGTNAANLMASGNQLTAAPLTGALPAGAEAAIQSSTDAAKAEIRSKFAAMGIPAGSSMEAEALATADQQAGVTRLNEAQTLANQGIQEIGLAQGEGQVQGNELTTLMDTSVKLALARQAGLSNALSNFSRALAGPAVGSGAGSTTLTLPTGTQVA
jgi:hypothetical protein